MSNNTVMKTEEQIKAEIVEQIKQSVAKLSEENPKLCKNGKTNKTTFAQLKAITPEQIELFIPGCVKRLKNLEFELIRQYRYTNGMGVKYLDGPKTMETALCGIGIDRPIYSLKGLNHIPKDNLFQYKKLFRPLLESNCYLNLYDVIDDENLHRDIKDLYETTFRQVNAAKLRLEPQETLEIVCSNWVILDEEIIDDLPAAIVWNYNNEGKCPLKTNIGKYNKNTGEFEIKSAEDILTGVAYTKEGYRSDCGKKVFSGNIFQRIVHFFDSL